MILIIFSFFQHYCAEWQTFYYVREVFFLTCGGFVCVKSRFLLVKREVFLYECNDPDSSL